MKKTYTSKELLSELGVQYYVLEYWVRTQQIRPLDEGRRPGRMRVFDEDQFQRARELARHTKAKAVSYAR